MHDEQSQANQTEQLEQIQENQAEHVLQERIDE
jgi:hypothetical protein